MKLLALAAAMILVSGCTAAVKSAEGIADADPAYPLRVGATASVTVALAR